MAYTITVPEEISFASLFTQIHNAGFTFRYRLQGGQKFYRIHFLQVRNEGTPKILNHSRWVRFNEVINDWLDAQGGDTCRFSDVRSSAYVVRVRGQRRLGYHEGDMHGLEDSWFYGWEGWASDEYQNAQPA